MKLMKSPIWILVACLYLSMPVFALDPDSSVIQAQGKQDDVVNETASSGTVSSETVLEASKDNSAERSAKETQDEVVSEPASSETDTEVVEDKAKGVKSEKPARMLVYIPPLRGSPGGRVGGGARGVNDEATTIYPLAPDHVGLTIREQPCIYWFIPKSTSHPIELTVIESHAIEPLIERRIEVPKKMGVQCIQLKEYGVRLQKEIVYKWFVAIVPDPDNRSKDILAGGMIERIDEPGGLRQKLNETNKDGAPYVYAEAGLWYDALDAISKLIDASPNNTSIREQRASLFVQVGLEEVAEFEMDYSVKTLP